MTVSWGGMGTLWHRPVVTVYVRPTRHTFSLMNGHPEFTLNVLPAARKAALQFCGTHSGRDLDKWSAAGLEPEPSASIGVPRVAGARLALECRTLSTLDFDPSRFLEAAIEAEYPKKDYHRVFLGHVLSAWIADA
jgi:flavin reductase (DIM6/NTAB) family NADH-FMN oxidoreductase RutF